MTVVINDTLPQPLPRHTGAGQYRRVGEVYATDQLRTLIMVGFAELHRPYKSRAL